MKTLKLLTTLGMMIPMLAPAADSIKLRDEKTGVEYGPVKIENGAKVSVGETTLVVTVLGQTEAQKALEQQLKSIIIPELNFRDATLQDAVEFYRMRARALDPQKEGVNILLALPADAAPQPLLTLNLRNVSLYDVLRYSSEAGNFRIRIDDNAVVLIP